MKAKLKKKMGTIVIVLICIILVLICGMMANNMIEMKKELKDLKKSSVQTESIREEVKKISKYSAYEVNYTTILHFSDKNEIEKLGLEIPLTGNRFIATVEGKMNIGINGELVELAEETDAEGNVTVINLKVPHSEIQDNYTIQDTLTIINEKSGIFNPVKAEDYNALLVKATEEEAIKVSNSDVLQKSDESIQYLLTTHLQTVYGDDVVINYEYLE